MALHNNKPRKPYNRCGAPPNPPNPDTPNVLMIGDSITMGLTGYGLFVKDVLGNGLATVQHAGGWGAKGQAGDSNFGVYCVNDYLGGYKWDVVTYNAGIWDCNMKKNAPGVYEANLRTIFTQLKAAAKAVVFVTTTPWDVTHNEEAPVSCARERNAEARRVANELGVTIADLHNDVNTFCGGDDFINCPIMCDHDVHFWHYCLIDHVNSPPRVRPSGQQYTAIPVAAAVQRLLPAARIAAVSPPAAVAPQQGAGAQCGAPAPLNPSTPNVLIIGDHSSGARGGCSSLVQRVLQLPRTSMTASEPPKPAEALVSMGIAGQPSNPLATVQHAGGPDDEWGTGRVATCIDSWLGGLKWDVIQLSFGVDDCLIDASSNASSTSAASSYAADMGAVLRAARASLAPSGKVVWMTPAPAAATGVRACADKQHAAAQTVLSAQPEVVVNDLRAVVSEVCDDAAQCPLLATDGARCSTAGQQFAAVQTAQVIQPLLGPSWRHIIWP